MRKFAFSLQRLLSLREHKEKEWETELGKVTSRCTGLKRDIRKRDELHKETLISRREDSVLVDFSASEMYMRRMREEAVRLREELVGAEKERLKVQEQYLEASRERKILDKLKERQEEEFYREQLKEEMKMIDDINTSAAVRKRNTVSRVSGKED